MALRELGCVFLVFGFEVLLDGCCHFGKFV
jgi:hypothetical protein